MNTRPLVGIFGAGGLGRELMPLAKTQCRRQFLQGFDVCFVEVDPKHDEINGARLVFEQDFFLSESADKYFVAAVGDPTVRKRIAERCIDRNVTPLEIITESTKFSEHSSIGAGAVIAEYTVITTNTVIGSFFYANSFCYVAHDCKIGDFVTFAAGVRCNGNVGIGNGAYIGAGAVIRDGSPSSPLTIGDGAIVGMGAVVTKSVPAFETVVGNPARPISKKIRL
ncbi:acetyltransferase [Agrobacterium sp. FDAARGOS_525]|uniref:acetyltransferase n=1 Tax=Agrobacterium sp. FDAARGOS_525 TaxID=2420311 RepID=UPI000F68AA01|nr:acetyltransferase [Agrobacterium sp. FDAARGOS_525]RSC30608.1 acetyltransferase [Agrobacterium sp. FDAARGOS_525]